MVGDGSELGAAGEAPASDGRRRRRQESGRRIIEALAAAIAEADHEVTAEQIAVRSGYSVSTIFRHFGGREGLRASMQKLVLSRLRDLLDPGPYQGDVHDRTGELVRRLAAAFEMVAPFLRFEDRRRAGMARPPGRRRLDRAVRDQIRLALADELAPLPADTLDILAAALSVNAWDHMRTTQGHGVERAAALMEVAVERLLGVESPSRR